MALIAILCVYTLVFISISLSQIIFLRRESVKKAVILDEKLYKESAQIGISNEKFKIISQIYTLILYSAWILWGFAWLKSKIIGENSVNSVNLRSQSSINFDENLANFSSQISANSNTQNLANSSLQNSANLAENPVNFVNLDTQNLANFAENSAKFNSQISTNLDTQNPTNFANFSTQNSINSAEISTNLNTQNSAANSLNLDTQNSANLAENPANSLNFTENSAEIFGIFSSSTLENTLFLLAFLAINTLATLPLSWYEDFVKDKKHGFSNMSAALFIKDTLRNLVLLGIFGFLLIFVLVFCFEKLGSWWWLGAFGVAFAAILIAQILYPTLIAPLYNKMQPLKDEHLQGEIAALMQKCGFKSSGVFVMDASKRDKRLNAYFGGLFRSKRVVLFDTLLKALKTRQLLAVLGHELGHFVHKDLLKGLFSSALMLFLLFFIFANLPEFFYTQSGLNGVNAGVFALFLIFGEIFTLIFSPFLNFLSRKNEFNADKHGAAMTSKADMSAALLVLARENKAFISSARLYEIFHLSHPTISQRLRALE